MKTKLLKKLRRIGQDQVHIHSVTKTNGTVTGMKIGYNEDKYGGLFCYGDSEFDVKKKAERIYIQDYILSKRALANVL